MTNLYSITVASYLDDSTYCVLVLSKEPLSVNNINIDAIAGIFHKKNYYYVSSVDEPDIIINSWNEEEHDELFNLRQLILNN